MGGVRIIHLNLNWHISFYRAGIKILGLPKVSNKTRNFFRSVPCAGSPLDIFTSTSRIKGRSPDDAKKICRGRGWGKFRSFKFLQLKFQTYFVEPVEIRNLVEKIWTPHTHKPVFSQNIQLHIVKFSVIFWIYCCEIEWTTPSPKTSAARHTCAGGTLQWVIIHSALIARPRELTHPTLRLLRELFKWGTSGLAHPSQ